MFGPLRVRGEQKKKAEKLARELLAKVGETSGGRSATAWRYCPVRFLTAKMMLCSMLTSAFLTRNCAIMKTMRDWLKKADGVIVQLGFAEK